MQLGDWEVIAVGKKVAPLAKLTNSTLKGIYHAAGKVVSSRDLAPLVHEITQLKTQGAINNVWIAYTHYTSSVTQQVKVEQLFDDLAQPINATETILNESVVFEPSESAVFDAVLTRYLSYDLYHAYIHASVSEQHARMTAMKQATDSAGDIIDALTLEYNKSRQQAITQEIAQIVGAAQAV